jgi:stalled ribosome rescue protein Dom34
MYLLAKVVYITTGLDQTLNLANEAQQVILTSDEVLNPRDHVMKASLVELLETLLVADELLHILALEANFYIAVVVQMIALRLSRG